MTSILVVDDEPQIGRAPRINLRARPIARDLVEGGGRGSG